jgi:hypothetical protein
MRDLLEENGLPQADHVEMRLHLHRLVLQRNQARDHHRHRQARGHRGNRRHRCSVDRPSTPVYASASSSLRAAPGRERPAVTTGEDVVIRRGPSVSRSSFASRMRGRGARSGETSKDRSQRTSANCRTTSTPARKAPSARNQRRGLAPPWRSQTSFDRRRSDARGHDQRGRAQRRPARGRSRSNDRSGRWRFHTAGGGSAAPRIRSDAGYRYPPAPVERLP